MHAEAQHLIDKLNLAPHPEGGYFRETYRSPINVPNDKLPAQFRGDRALATAIYFLLTDQDFSAFHRLKQDEIWHFHTGATVFLRCFTPKGEMQTMALGSDLEQGAEPQHIVPGGWTFGAHLSGGPGYALVSCTVAPGFEYDDFELLSRGKLLQLHPEHADIIKQLTKD